MPSPDWESALTRAQQAIGKNSEREILQTSIAANINSLTFENIEKTSAYEAVAPAEELIQKFGDDRYFVSAVDGILMRTIDKFNELVQWVKVNRLSEAEFNRRHRIFYTFYHRRRILKIAYRKVTSEHWYQNQALLKGDTVTTLYAVANAEHMHPLTEYDDTIF